MMWLGILNVLCTLLPIITFASPATVFVPVLLSVDGGSDEVIEMPPLALTTQMLQCFLFGIYAHHLQMWTLFIPNVAGFLLGFLWSTIYPFKVAHDNSRFKVQWKVQYTFALLLMLLGSLTVQRIPYLSSTIAAGVGVTMCTYPFPTMQRAYHERNSNLMGSTVMNIAMFTTCSAWVVHSSPLVEYDIFVLVSNAAGVVVQCGALILRIVISRTEEKVRDENALLLESTPIL